MPTHSRALSINKASIENGMLAVSGTTGKRNMRVKLDGVYNTISNAQKRYEFPVLYHPED